MSEKSELVPELRFSEFEKDGEWELSPFSKFIKLYRGSSPRPIREYSTESESGVNWIKIGDTSSITDYVIRSVDEKITPEGAERSRAVKKGELILANSMSYGSTYLLEVEGYIYDGWFVLREFEDFFDKQFLLQLLNSKYTQDQYKKYAAGGIVQNISSEIVYNITLPKTSRKEQQKIADCLSSLDELISAHNEKLEALRDHKKGLLQNLFPQEGETVPKVRFPEFEKDGEWISKPIEEVFSIFQGYAFSSKDSVSSGIRWLKIADVGIQKMNHDSPSFLPKTHKEEFERFLLKKGDFVLALTRPILDMQLKIARVDDTFHDSLLNQRVGKVVTSNNPGFVYYLLQTSELVESIDRNIAGSEPPNLSFKQISDIEVFIPTDKSEQRKIASFLSNIDSLISEQIKKIEQLQQHKKGLMQGLFPKVEG